MRDQDTLADNNTWPATAPVERISATAESLLRFKLGATLGKGGMGEVVSARDDVLGRSVAIKRMRSEKPSAASLERFLREARIQARLEHPAVVPVHELHHDEAGNPFFVMKQVTGVTLADVIRRLALGDRAIAKRFSRRRLLSALADVCLAMELAHTRGVVHRDLKPSNIILGEFGEIYVIDWGIAHVMPDEHAAAEFADVRMFDEHIVQDGIILGSPGYMSPEQIRVDPDLDGRSDVYALGCILFELLTHEPLHEPGLQGIARALAGIECRPSVRAPEMDIPPELDVICVTATKPDRGERYKSARELHDAIQTYLDGDRDLALRKDLAATELADARAALGRATGDKLAGPEMLAERRQALRAAARALALDPTSKGPAELVGRLMLEPPSEIPREVTDALDRADDDALWSARRLIVLAATSYLAFIPILFVIGFSSPWYLGACAVVAAAMCALAFTAKRERVWVVAYTGLIGNSLMTMLFAYIATPFFVAPSLGVITAMSIATHPRVARAWVLVAVIASSVLAPLALEVAGVLPRSMQVHDDTIVLVTAASGLDVTTTTIALVCYVVALLAMAVILAKSLTNDRRIAQRRVHIQSWHAAARADLRARARPRHDTPDGTRGATEGKRSLVGLAPFLVPDRDGPKSRWNGVSFLPCTRLTRLRAPAPMTSAQSCASMRSRARSGFRVSGSRSAPSAGSSITARTRSGDRLPIAR
jgi:serine/threonine-protein kinase